MNNDEEIIVFGGSNHRLRMYVSEGTRSVNLRKQEAPHYVFEKITASPGINIENYIKRQIDLGYRKIEVFLLDSINPQDFARQIILDYIHGK